MLNCSADRKGGAADYDEGNTPANPCDFLCLDYAQAAKGRSLTEATPAENPKAVKFRGSKLDPAAAYTDGTSVVER